MDKLKEILEELARHTYSDKYISTAQSQIEKWIEECIGSDKPCSNPNIRPAEYVTHDMALDAEDRSLEGQLYRSEEAEQCGNCMECLENMFRQEILQKVRGEG